MRWHTDRSWRRDPALATILYGVEVPSTGGDTLFVNCAKAYEGLPAEMKQRIDSLFAVHSVEYSRRTAPEGPAATEYELRNHPPTPHPLARRHPVTGRPAIYIGCHAWKIDGMPEIEGRRLLDELLDFATQDAYVYAHKWRRARSPHVGQPLHDARGHAVRHGKGIAHDVPDRRRWRPDALAVCGGEVMSKSIALSASFCSAP